MADGLIFGFDTGELDRAVERANKKIDELANKSELASKRINTALGMIGNVGIDTSTIQSATSQLSDLVQRIDTAIDKASRSDNPKFLEKMKKNSQQAVDEINKIILALNTVNRVSIGNDTDVLSSLRSAYEKADKKFKDGGYYTQKGDEKVFNAYSNTEMQDIIDERKALQDLIHIRERSTKEQIESAQKLAELERRENERTVAKSRKEYQNLANEKRALNEKLNSSYVGSLKFSESANTLHRQKLAIKYLESARSSINVSEDGSIERIERLTAEIERHKRQIEALTRSERSKKADFEKKKKANMSQMVAEVDAESWEKDYARFAESASKRYDKFLEEKKEAEKRALQDNYDKSIEAQNKELENASKNLGKEREERKRTAEEAFKHANKLEEEAKKERKKRAEKDKSESIAEYKRTLAELKGLNKEQKSIDAYTAKYGESDKTRTSEDSVLRRYSELIDKKVALEERGYDKIYELNQKFERERSVSEIESAKKRRDTETAERKKDNEDAVRDYKAVIAEMRSIKESLNLIDKSKNELGEYYSASEEEKVLLERMESLNNKKLALEKKYDAHLFKEKRAAEVEDAKASAAAAVKAAKELKKEDEARMERQLRTPSGAMDFSNNVKSIDDERKAIGYLVEARDKLSKSTQNYEEVLKALNERIDAHRISIESKTKSQENTNTLKPGIRNEYERILKELDAIEDKQKKIRDFRNSHESPFAMANEEYDLELRKQDLEDSRKKIEESAQGQLDAIARKHAAARAKNEVDEFIRAERIKAKEAEAEDKKKRKEYLTSYEGSIESSKNAKNVLQMTQAVKNLKAARERLLKTDSQYKVKLKILNEEIARNQKEIDNVIGKTKELKKAQRGLLDLSGQLARKLALMFSVSQIQGYVNYIVKIRGEFELQRKSLEVLLQDKEEADEIWDKTIALAVKSPFRIKDLVTYTKQLAAYRVESDKLYQTNKMLADVSAGLGVEMDRLILAYGQVKAANFLRGTELRQFSEAGVNMLEELARYFTEIEGRAVSVADVFDRVSKRMVSFADVEEIFKRITAEGGIFFEMQEKQSETLKGMMMNLRDSIDLMVDDIGNENNNVIKNIVRVTKYIIDNWREITPIITSAGTAFLVFFGVKQLIKIGKGIAYATQQLRMFINTGKWSAKTNPWVVLASVIASVAMYIYEATEGENRFVAAMNDIDKEVKKNLQDSITLYKKLVKTINDSTTSYEERNRAMSNLQSKFEKILPQQYLEIEYIKNISDNYDGATRAMMNYYNSKAVKQKEDKVESMFSKELYETDIPELQNTIKKAYKDKTNAAYLKVQKEYNDAKIQDIISGIDGVVNSVIEDVKKDVIGIDKIQQEIEKRLAKYAGVSEKSVHGFLGTIPFTYNEDIKDITQTLTEYKTALMSVQGLPFETAAQARAAKILNQQESYVKEAESMFNEAVDLYRKGSKALEDGNKEHGGKLIEQADAIVKNVPDTMSIYKNAIKQTFDDLNKAAKSGTYEFESSVQTIQSNFYKRLGGSIKYIKLPQKEWTQEMRDFRDKFKQGLISKGESLELNDFQKSVEQVFSFASSRNKGDINIFSKIFPKMGDTLSTVRTSLKGELESWKTMIDEWETSGKTNLSSSLLEGVFSTKKEEIDFMKHNLPTLETALKMLGESPKYEKKENKDNLKILQERIKLLKEIHEEYKKVRQENDKESSVKQVVDSYSDTFKKVFSGTGINLSSLIRLTPDNKEELSQAATDAASIISKKVDEELIENSISGNKIREFSGKLLKKIKKDEGFRSSAYKNNDGKWTIGYGETQGVQKGDTITKEVAEAKLRKRLLEDYVPALNKVLDSYRDLFFTQEQYDSLLNLTYQGGPGAVKNLLSWSEDVDMGVSHIEKIYKKIKSVFGEKEANRFGNEFVNKFKEAGNMYERIALLLQTMNLTQRGGIIDKDEYKGMQRRSDERAELFSGIASYAKETKNYVEDINSYDFTSLTGLLNALQHLMESAKEGGEESIKSLSREASKTSAEIGLEEKKEEDKRILDTIDSMFESYQLSFELEESGVPKDLIKNLFKIDAKSLKDIREYMDSQNFDGKNMEEKYQAYFKKLEEEEDKSQKRRLKKYLNYLIEAQSNSVKIKIDELRQIEEVESSKEFNDEQKIHIINNLKKESSKKYDQAVFEEFKNSGLYTDMFSDLERSGTKTLNLLYEKLNEKKESLKFLPPEQYKELMGLFDKIENLKIDNRPFKELAHYSKLVQSLGKSRKELQDELVDNEFNRNSYQEQLDNVNLLISSARGNIKLKDDELAKAEEIAQVDGKDLKTLDLKRITLEENISSLDKSTISLLEQLGWYKKILKASDSCKKKTKEWTDAIGKLLNSVDALLDSMGVAEDSTARLWIQNTIHIVEMISQILILKVVIKELGLEMNSALGVIGWVAIALETVASIFSSIWGLGDKKKEKQIQAEIKLVEELERQYEKLEKAIEKAYSVNTLRESIALSDKNVKEQIEARERMIQLEEDKKKTDRDKIDGWKREIEDLREAQEELKKEQVENMGGTYDYRSAARDFHDAWLDAFKETGNGLDGLGEHFRSFVQNLVAEQAIMRGLGKIIEPLMKKVTDSIENDYMITDDEWSRIDGVWNSVAERGDEFLKEFYSHFPGLLEDSKDSLSSLQKGIQGITENTAEIIAAYLNSIRAFVAETNDNLKRYVSFMTNGEESNPMISQLKIIANQTTAIHQLLDSVVKSGHPAGGYGIRVFMD